MSRPKSDTVQVNLRLPRAHIARAEALAARMAPMGAISPTTAMRAALARGLDAYDIEAGVLSDEPRWPPGPSADPLTDRSKTMNTAESDVTRPATIAMLVAGVLGIRLAAPAQTAAPEVDEKGRPTCPSTNFRCRLDAEPKALATIAAMAAAQLVRDSIGGTIDDTGVRSGSPIAACGVYVREERETHLVLTAWARPQ